MSELELRCKHVEPETDEAKETKGENHSHIPEWEVGLFDCHYLGPCCCILAFTPVCGSSLVMARALSEMEGGGMFCFFAWCGSSPLSRSYMRQVYRIPGDAGWDCCLFYCCHGCVAAQMLGQVYIAGPPDTYPATNDELTSNFIALPSECRDSVCLDPCNLIHSVLCIQCLSSAHVTAATGLPAWVSCCYSSYCLNHHIIRMNYGIPGSTQWNDCLEPILCSLLYIPPMTVFGMPISLCYFTQMTENERVVIKKAAENGLPRLFLTSNIGAITTQPHVASEMAPVFTEEQQGATREATTEPDSKTMGMARTWGPWLLSYGLLSVASFCFRSHMWQ